MTPEHLRQIEELYHAVRDAHPGERAALLARTDPEVRRELESLFKERTGGEFLDSPAIEHASELLPDAHGTSLVAGDCLGPYRIEGIIGEGGMGQVYRAVDTRLGRAIAIKTSREQFGSRFEGEARAISALNHPNICTLHDIGPNYLVMELVEGETLAAILKRGPLPVRTAILNASQIAAALDEAHGKGIIHRDLKPGNIMIGKSGVKVLDFGLAHMDHQEGTVTDGHMMIGTPAYMAPEQRDGKPGDALSDIYSFGCILYEIFSGARVGSTPRRRITPRRMEKIVNRCLEEDPGKRWQSAAELQRELAAVTPVRHGLRLTVAGAAVLALSAFAWFYSSRNPKLMPKDRIVLADFENKTGDPVFDQALRQGLAVQLEQSPFFALVPEASIRQSLRFMKRSPDTPLTIEVAREVCERSGGAAVLEGSIASVGSQYVLGLRAKKCASGDTLVQEQEVAGKKEEVLGALSRITTRIRSRLGESLAAIQEHSPPLEQATTSSLEALKAYGAGRVAIFRRGGALASLPHFKEAIAIDPQFAMAHAQLGFMAWNSGQTDLGAGEVRIAYGLRDRVSDREKRYITMLYDREVTGNLQKEMQTLEAWLQIYPRDTDAMAIVGGWAAQGTGQYERGIQAGADVLRVDPNMTFGYTVAIHYLSLDRFAEAESILGKAAERGLELPEMLVTRYYLAFLKDDLPGMQREIARAPGELATDWMFHHQALVLARSGRMRDARNMWDHAVALAQQAGRREDSAIYRAAEAVCDAHFGYAAEARTLARSALDLAKGRDVTYAAAFALASSGDTAGSEAAYRNLAERFPEDTPVQFEYLPTLGALLALHNQAPSQAIERLQVARPYDLAMPGTSFFAKFGGLYTAYVRGQACIAAGHGPEAAAEFQKVLEHRGVVLADPIGALAHLQLGRAYSVQGDIAKAKSAYQNFLTLWKNADADIPVLKRAKAEYAKL
jgi:serine/threonine protein kinase/tetratricopeptide (TPR) repeat protein